MREEISRLVDGELESEQFDAACGELKARDGMATWVCYHMIGETLREGRPGATPTLSQKLLDRLEAEPTVMAPGRRLPRPVMSYAWAAAATVAAVTLTGWVAFSSMQPAGISALAKARDAAQMRAAQLRPAAVPQDYLIAHQEYSPTTPLQGLSPSVRMISVQGAPGGSR